MKLTIVLVNYKCDKSKLQSCLNSIRINTDILIIDNSHDFTFENIIKPANLQIKIIKNENLGNGAGINCGIENSETRYVLYLDIDTILPLNFFRIIDESIKKLDNFAVIAPKINNFYKDKHVEKRGNLSRTSFYYNMIFHKIRLEKKNFDNLKKVFFVSGSIMLFDKKNTYEKNIKFDENIFMFYEENDFFHQCFKKDQKIYLINNLHAEHSDGSINDKSLKYESFKKWHWEWSKYYFLNKHYNKVFISVIALKSIFKFCIKIGFYYLTNNNRYTLNKTRLNGLISLYYKRKCNIKY
jgi:N-acetylglucosaminyl-diphospho-decaprenol L-rhamnosyltransferase